MNLVTSLLAAAIAVALPPKVPPMLSCELKVDAKDGAAPAEVKAEVTITNTTAAAIDIPWTANPLQYLDLKVTGPGGAELKTAAYASRFSPFSPLPQHLTIKPGESYRAAVGALTTVAPADLRSGTYKVRAVYTFQDRKYESKEVSVPVAVR